VTLPAGSEGHRGRVWPRLQCTLLVALIVGCEAFCPATEAFAAEPAGKPVIHTISIDGVAFQPDTLVVNRGETVVWVNKDPFPHTVTAPGAFDSHDIPPGASWKYVARKPGTYAYICTLHSNMKGTLTVR
jgi:plastocyanin